MVGRPEKFEPLTKFLKEKAEKFCDSGETSLRMKFRTIEELGVVLPGSAYRHRAWWSNNRFIGTYAKSRSYKPWDRAQFQVKDVDMTNLQLTFEYVGPFSKAGETAQKEKNIQARTRFDEWRSQLKSGSETTQMNSARPSSGMANIPRPYTVVGKEGTPRRHPIFGALKGQIRIVAGTDLTEPADPEWGERVWGDDPK